ncbi:MAG: hypothetical protein FJW34_05310 [Acidobacteria bacterium]|nr:hypothetical protein [Acidobacteriota bacterium]
MQARLAAAVVTLAAVCFAQTPEARPPRPRAGKAEILKSAGIQPGMKGYAWTVFAGAEPEAMPVEIVGLWKNAWGPRQDVIIAKLGGKAARTNVAAGMSGSPVYVDGKLIGAISTRMSVFSPDAICGITPIELMLEVAEFDDSRPADARTPDQAAEAGSPPRAAGLAHLETPLTFAGFDASVLDQFAPAFRQLGVTAVQGGAAGSLAGPRPAPGWQQSLQPGDAVAAVLVSGDMSITGLGTVTYNDGRRVLAFGHPLFNLGPLDMPMSRAEVLLTHASSFQPGKFANATEIVGAFRQDRHSAIMGVLGETAAVVPVSLTVRSFADDNSIRRQKDFRFNVFVQQKWTPYLMMVTLFNSISGLNDFREESTFRLSGKVELAGQQSLVLSTMQAPGEMAAPVPMLLAIWWGDKFNRLFLNAVKTPQLKRVDAVIDLLPERRVAAIESAWLGVSEAEPGQEVPLKVFLRPYRGPRIARDFTLRLPQGLAKGEHRILLSDADTLNRLQNSGFLNRFIDLPQAVSLINQERRNDRLYISLVEARPTLFYDDKTLPSLPASVLNVMQAGRSASRSFATSGESALEQMAVPFEHVITGSYALKLSVR